MSIAVGVVVSSVPPCPKNDELDAFRAGQSEGERTDTISAHLDTCASCQAKLNETEKLDRLLREKPPVQTAEAGYRRLDSWALSDRTDIFDPARSLDKPRLRPATPGTADLGRIGPYRILRILGEGAMGVVYEARDPRLDRLVALKALKPYWSKDESSRSRFLREAKAAAKIIDDRIVAVYDVGDDEGLPYITMALLKGQSLEQRLRDQPRPAVAEIVDFAKQIALGLMVAHSHGLIHRDIKPANIWIEPNRVTEQTPHGLRVKLLDFGLARCLGEDVRLTQSGMVLGTPAYMAPESANGNGDARGDLFSLGCVLYRMTSGVLPFAGKDTFGILYALANTHPAPPRQVNPAIPESLSALVMKLLAKNPANRPESAADVIAALDRMPDELDHGSRRLQARRATEVSDPRLRLGRVGRRNTRGRWLIAAGCLALVALTFAFWRSPPVEVVPEVTKTIVKKSDPVTPVLPVVKHPWETLAFPAWLKHVVAMPAEEQVKAVAKKLVDLNPNFDGEISRNEHGEPALTIEDGKVTEIVVFTNRVNDLSPLRAFGDLKSVRCFPAGPLDGILEDLSPLQGMRLTTLDVHGNRSLLDVSPLRGMPLTRLNLWMSQVADLSPLEGMKLESLNLSCTACTNLAPLRGMPLTHLDLNRVLEVTDLAPLKGMKMTWLVINQLRITDLSDLRGMPLERLEANGLEHVTDLSPLRGMPLTNLQIESCPKITDLSPLKDLPLQSLQGDSAILKKAAFLRSMASLQTINGMPAAEFCRGATEKQ